MKRKRKFYFKKNIEITNYHFGKNILDTTYEYKTISNIYIAKEIINLLNKNGLNYKHLKDWDFNDWDYCWVEIKSTKEEYFRFVYDFIDTFEEYMEDYKFN